MNNLSRLVTASGFLARNADMTTSPDTIAGEWF
jgi:hypothetical protein